MDDIKKLEETPWTESKLKNLYLKVNELIESNNDLKYKLKLLEEKVNFHHPEEE